MKTYSIITYGCQANRSDSERIASVLESFGLKSVTSKPDLTVINLCSIRQSAVDRAMAAATKTEGKLIITGCIIESDKKKMSELSDYLLDIRELPKWPEIIGLGPSLPLEDYFEIEPISSRYIPIMTGCNNFCSYCVVPFTRGREYSRPFDKIVSEAKRAISVGVKEIWLLGQNVDSYRDGRLGLADLIKEIDLITGDFWISFLSSHPKDLTQEIIESVVNSKKATHYINLPVQSGDDTILKKMNRPYTVSEYKESVDMIMKLMPDATLSTDIIVGFPSESEDSFNKTADLMRELKFDMAYISKYSPRRGTASFKLKDDVSFSEKNRRQRALTEILKETALDKNRELVGKELTALVQDQVDGLLIGKTKNYKTVKFSGPKELIGSFVKIKIKEALPWGLSAIIQ